MFKKKKRTYYSRISRDDCYCFTANSGNEGSTSDEILDAIQRLYEKDGQIVIDFINDGSIEVKSLNTLKDDIIESKMNEIRDIVREKFKLINIEGEG